MNDKIRKFRILIKNPLTEGTPFAWGIEVGSAERPEDVARATLDELHEGVSLEQMDPETHPGFEMFWTINYIFENDLFKTHIEIIEVCPFYEKALRFLGWQ